MPNTIQKIYTKLYCFKKPSVLSENLKTLTRSNYPTVHFFAETSHTFTTYQCLEKDVWDFFSLFRS